MMKSTMVGRSGSRSLKQLVTLSAVRRKEQWMHVCWRSACTPSAAQEPLLRGWSYQQSLNPVKITP